MSCCNEAIKLKTKIGRKRKNSKRKLQDCNKFNPTSLTLPLHVNGRNLWPLKTAKSCVNTNMGIKY